MDPFRPMTFDNRPVAPVFLDSNPVTDGVANFAAALMNAGPAANQIREQRAAAELAKMWKDREWERQQAQDKLAALWHNQAQDRQIANDERLGRMTDAQIANLEADNARANLVGLSREGRGWLDSVGKLFHGGGGGGAKGTAKEQKKSDVFGYYKKLKKDYENDDDNQKMIQDLESFGDNLTQEQMDLLNWLKLQQKPQAAQTVPNSTLIDKGLAAANLGREATVGAQVVNAGKNVAVAPVTMVNQLMKGVDVAKPAVAGRPFLSSPESGWFGLAGKEVAKEVPKASGVLAKALGFGKNLGSGALKVAKSPGATLFNGAMAAGDIGSYFATGKSITGDGEWVGEQAANFGKWMNNGFNPENKEQTMNNWALNQDVPSNQLWGNMIQLGNISEPARTKEAMAIFIEKADEIKNSPKLNFAGRLNALKMLTQKINEHFQGSFPIIPIPGPEEMAKEGQGQVVIPELPGPGRYLKDLWSGSSGGFKSSLGMNQQNESRNLLLTEQTREYLRSVLKREPTQQEVIESIKEFNAGGR